MQPASKSEAAHANYVNPTVDAKLFNERFLKWFKFCVFIQSKDMAHTFKNVLGII